MSSACVALSLCVTLYLLLVLNGDENVAVYDRAVPKLSAGPRRKLGACPELAAILETYRIALV